MSIPVNSTSSTSANSSNTSAGSVSSSSSYTSLKSLNSARGVAPLQFDEKEKDSITPPLNSAAAATATPHRPADIGGPKPIFDAIVITAASPLQSRAYTLELEMRKRLGFLPASTLVLSVPDPAGVRVGSGGATLNALAVVAQRLCINAGYADLNYRFLKSRRVLILHSGGDSQRIPIFSVRGKAFSTLPSIHSPSSHLMAPVDFLIRQMADLCREAPEGGCVVLATDVLLLFPSAFKWRADVSDGVTGIGIVTEQAIGPNHGVFVPAANAGGGAVNFHDEELVQVEVSDIIQKATVAQLTAAGAVRQDALGQGRVLLDSGIIYLSARVTMDFLRLYESAPFDACTDAGLDSGSHPFRFELYTDVLHAMNPRLTRAEYLATPPPTRDSDPNVLSKGRALLWKAFRQYKFFVSSSPQSHFAHLGTIEEYLNYLSTRTLFTEPFSLASRAHFFTSYPSLVASSAILINSLLLGHGSVDDRALIENSLLRGSFQVGARSVVSGVRSLSGIKVPNDSVIMEVQLSEERVKSDPRVRHILQGQQHAEAQWNSITPQSTSSSASSGGLSYEGVFSPRSIRVIVVLGLHDQIKEQYRKSSASFVNRPWAAFLSSHALAPTIEDLWSAAIPDTARNLWNARIFPIILGDGSSGDEHESSLWLQFADVPSVQVLHRWKHATRVSLEDILALADCEAEFYWRTRASFLVDMKEIEAVLLEKQQRSILPIISRCDPHYKHHLLAYLDSVAASSFHSPAICSRALCSIADVLASYLPSVSKFQRSGPSRNPQWRKALQMLEDARNTEEHANAIRELSFIRNEWLSSARGRGDGAIWLSSFATPAEIMRAARHFDGAWQALCRKGVQSIRSLAGNITFAAVEAPKPLTWVDVDMPVRFDLMGGWSDTPPITQETVGRVVNVAVKINDDKPIGCSARTFLLEEGSHDIIVLRLGKQKFHPPAMAHLPKNENKEDNGALAEDEVVIIRKLEDIFDHANPIAPAALMKCCLVVLGVIDIRSNVPLVDQLALALGKQSGLGLEVRAYSTLPQGTGLGVSSILAVSIIAAIAPFIGRIYSKHALLHLVLLVEQALTTGGGWQDQAGGIYGGFKITESSGCLPLSVATSVISCSPAFVKLFDQHVLLIHTGQSRLAKNLLQTVLRSWYHSDSAIVDTVQGLVTDALKMKAAIETSDVSEVGRLLSQFWHYKKTMAMPTRSDAVESFHEAPVEPKHISRLIHALSPLVYGLALVGAGGGGFLLLVTKAPLAESKGLVEAVVKGLNDEAKARAWAEEAIGEWPSDDYKIYEAQVDEEGMKVSPQQFQPFDK